MSQPKMPPPAAKPIRLTDDDMKSRELDRRSFLSKLGVRSTVVLSAVLATTTSCSDDCDNDVTTGGDANDPIAHKKDSCDNDSA